jgi:phage shock protein E
MRDWNILLVVAAVFVALFLMKRTSFVAEATAKKLLQEGAVVVDVREPNEFASGHVAGAVNIPLGSLRESLPRRFADKNRVLLLHCLSGTRSGIARKQLLALGYANAFNLGSYSRAQRIVASSGAQASN